MLANGAKETTTTTGTGTVTLSAVTGYPRFSQVLSVGQFVDYAIQDGSNWEWGVGKVAAGNTLERTFITAKFDGGTYSKTPATKLSLSGDATVFCTLTAERAGPVPGGSAFHSFGPGPVTSAHVVHSSAYGSSIALNGNLLYWTPFVWPQGADRVITKLQVLVTTGGTATKLRIGVLKPIGGTLGSLQLLAQTDDIAVSTTGLKTSTLAAPLALADPRFMLVLITDGTVTLRAPDAVLFDLNLPMDVAEMFPRSLVRNGSSSSGWSEITNGMLQSGWITADGGSGKAPCIYVRQD